MKKNLLSIGLAATLGAAIMPTAAYAAPDPTVNYWEMHTEQEILDQCKETALHRVPTTTLPILGDIEGVDIDDPAGVQTTENDKPLEVNGGDTLTYVANVDSSVVKYQMYELTRHFAAQTWLSLPGDSTANNNWGSALLVPSATSVFTAEVSAPEEITFPSESASYVLNGGPFDLTNVEVADNDHKVTVTMTFNKDKVPHQSDAPGKVGGKSQTMTFNDIYDAIPDSLTLTAQNVTISDDAAVNTNYTIKGVVSGSFKGTACSPALASDGNTDTRIDPEFTWTAVQDTDINNPVRDLLEGKQPQNTADGTDAVLANADDKSPIWFTVRVKGYQAIFNFESGTAGKELPDAIRNMTPERLRDLRANQKLSVNGNSLQLFDADGVTALNDPATKFAKQFHTLEVLVDKNGNVVTDQAAAAGKWTFANWKPEDEVAFDGSDADSTVRFNGTWMYEEFQPEQPAEPTKPSEPGKPGDQGNSDVKPAKPEEKLPDTGSHAGTASVLAALLLAAGGVAMVARRKLS